MSISCRKDRTCTCTSTLTETKTQGGTTITSTGSASSSDTYKKITKSQSKLLNCYNRTETYTNSGGSGSNAYTTSDVTVYSCKLK